MNSTANRRERIVSRPPAISRAEPEVIYYDNHLIVVNKPSGMVTHEDGVHEDTLRAWVEAWAIKTYNKGLRAFVVPVHRLDAGTSGIVVFAKTQKALSRMMEIFRERLVKKWYQLQTPLVASCTQDGLWIDWLARNESHSHVAKEGDSGAQLASMQVRRLGYDLQRCEWEVELHTGRHHQIRVQFSSRGIPVDGDTRYGGRSSSAPGFLLHHIRLEFDHPVKHEPMRLIAPLPPYWPPLEQLPVK